MNPTTVHITGAAGTGATTLGRALAAATGRSMLDVDDYFWRPSHPPFQAQTDPVSRLAALDSAIQGANKTGSVLCGSIMGWGDKLLQHCELIVFLTASTEVRLARIRSREIERVGEDAIAAGGSMFEKFAKFEAWARAYDDGGIEGRTRERHERWLSAVGVPVMRLDGERETSWLLLQIQEWLRRRSVA